MTGLTEEEVKINREKYGSNILATLLLAQKTLAIKIPKTLAVVKLIIVSYKV